MTTTQSPSYQSSDSDYLEWVMTLPASEYVPCTRCGVRRKNTGNPIPELCQTCQFFKDEIGAIRDPSVDTPCFGSTEFWELEAEAQRELQPSGRQRYGVRLELLAKHEGEARERFCGECPLVQQCLQWGKDEGYTGLAGGRWLKDGKTQDEIDAERGQPNQYTPIPDECKRGHSLKEHGVIDKRGFRRCRACKRITNREAQARKRQRELVAA